MRLAAFLVGADGVDGIVLEALVLLHDQVVRVALEALDEPAQARTPK